LSEKVESRSYSPAFHARLSPAAKVQALLLSEKVKALFRGGGGTKGGYRLGTKRKGRFLHIRCGIIVTSRGRVNLSRKVDKNSF
jgi:hypothetical protein